MVIEACTCNWGIPGVTQLPAHSHRSWARVQYDGEEFTMLAHDLDLNPGVVVLDQGEDISIWVRWKDVARG